MIDIAKELQILAFQGITLDQNQSLVIYDDATVIAAADLFTHIIRGRLLQLMRDMKPYGDKLNLQDTRTVFESFNQEFDAILQTYGLLRFPEENEGDDLQLA